MEEIYFLNCKLRLYFSLSTYSHFLNYCYQFNSLLPVKVHFINFEELFRNTLINFYLRFSISIILLKIRVAISLFCIKILNNKFVKVQNLN